MRHIVEKRRAKSSKKLTKESCKCKFCSKIIGYYYEDGTTSVYKETYPDNMSFARLSRITKSFYKEPLKDFFCAECKKFMIRNKRNERAEILDTSNPKYMMQIVNYNLTKCNAEKLIEGQDIFNYLTAGFSETRYRLLQRQIRSYNLSHCFS